MTIEVIRRYDHIPRNWNTLACSAGQDGGDQIKVCIW